MPLPSSMLLPASTLFPGGVPLNITPQIDLPTPMVLDGHVTTLTLKGDATEMTVDGD